MKITEVKMGGGYKLPLPGIQFSGQDSWVSLTISDENGIDDTEAKHLGKKLSDALLQQLRETLEGDGKGIIAELVVKQTKEQAEEHAKQLDSARKEYKKLLDKYNAK